MKKYIYLDRKKAKTGLALVYMVSNEKIEDYKEYFEGNAVEFYGEDLPHYITYLEESDTVRESTEEEKYFKGYRILNEGEAIIDGVIAQYDIYSQKVVDGEIIDKTRADYITEKIITLESEKEKARSQREKEFEAYQKLISNYNIGVEVLEIEGLNRIIEWRAAWLDVPNNYTYIDIDIEESYPERPEKVDYYIN